MLHDTQKQTTFSDLALQICPALVVTTDFDFTMWSQTKLSSAFCLALAIQVDAQFSAGQAVDVATYHNELRLEGAGSYQRILYEEATNSTMSTTMIWSEIYVAPCGASCDTPMAFSAMCLRNKVTAVLVEPELPLSLIVEITKLQCTPQTLLQGYGCQ